MFKSDGIITKIIGYRYGAQKMAEARLPDWLKPGSLFHAAFLASLPQHCRSSFCRAFWIEINNSQHYYTECRMILL